MNLKSEVVEFPKRYKPIPKPYFVTRLDDHFIVCTLDDDFNLIDERSPIHWNVYQARRWALRFAENDVVHEALRKYREDQP